MIKSIMVIMAVIICNNIYAQSGDDNGATGFIDPNGYYDSRGHSEVTINILSNFPKSRIQYFSFVNYTGQEENADLSTYFSEQNLRWRITEKSPLYLHSQLAVRDGQNNDAIRFGFRWVANQQSFLKDLTDKLHLQYALATFVLQYGYSNPYHWFTQFEHAYRISLLNSKAYISGFADQNMRYNGGQVFVDWVTEHQLGIRIVDEFYAITEYRINEYLIESEGWGFGLEYKITF